MSKRLAVAWEYAQKFVKSFMCDVFFPIRLFFVLVTLSPEMLPCWDSSYVHVHLMALFNNVFYIL